MNRAAAELLYMRAKLDAKSQDAYRLAPGRLRMAFDASESYSFADWCERVGIELKEAQAEGNENGNAALTAFTAIAAAGGPVKIEHHERRSSDEMQDNTVDAASHFAALKKQVDQKQQKQA